MDQRGRKDKVLKSSFESASNKGGSAFMGGVDPSKHHEGCSHYAILLF